MLDRQTQTAVEVSAPASIEDFLEKTGRITVINEEDPSQNASLVLLTSNDETRAAFNKCLQHASATTLLGTHDILGRLFTFEGVQSVTLTKEDSDKYKVDVYCNSKCIPFTGKTLYDAHLNALNMLRISSHNWRRHI